MGLPNKFIYFYGDLKIFREISKIPPTGAQINKDRPLRNYLHPFKAFLSLMVSSEGSLGPNMVNFGPNWTF